MSDTSRDPEPLFVLPPTDDALLVANPEAAALLDGVARAAAQWVRTGVLYFDCPQIVVETADDGRVERWDLAAHLAYFVSGQREGAPSPYTRRAQQFVGRFRFEAIASLAHEFMAEAGYTADQLSREFIAWLEIAQQRERYELAPEMMLTEWLSWLSEHYAGTDGRNAMERIQALPRGSLAGTAIFDALVDLERRRQLAAEVAARTTAEQERDRERAERLEAERALERERRKKGITFGNVVIPGQVYKAGFESAYIDRLLAEGEQQDLFAPGVRDLLSPANNLEIASAQLGQLSKPEISALVAVFRIFGTDGDGPADDGQGRKFKNGVLHVPAATWYAAAEVSSRNGRATRLLFHGTDSMAGRQPRIALRMTDEEGRATIIGERTPIFQVKFVWHATDDGRKGRRTAEEAAKIAEAWARHDPRKPWTEALPDEYIITLPPIARLLYTKWVIRGDILKLLDEGAKKVHGPSASWEPIDWMLFTEITQRIQSQHGRRSYVDRDRVLLNVHGAENVAKWKARGKYQSTYYPGFEMAAQRLVASGIVTSWEPGQRVRSRGSNDAGVRDVFVLSDDVVKGLTPVSDAVASATGEPGPRQLPAGSKKRKRGRKP